VDAKAVAVPRLLFLETYKGRCLPRNNFALRVLKCSQRGQFEPQLANSGPTIQYAPEFEDRSSTLARSVRQVYYYLVIAKLVRVEIKGPNPISKPFSGGAKTSCSKRRNEISGGIW